MCPVVSFFFLTREISVSFEKQILCKTPFDSRAPPPPGPGRHGPGAAQGHRARRQSWSLLGDTNIPNRTSAPFLPSAVLGDVGCVWAAPEPHPARGAGGGAGLPATQRDAQWDDRDFEQINKTCGSRSALSLAPAPTLRPTVITFAVVISQTAADKTHPRPLCRRGPGCGSAGRPHTPAAPEQQRFPFEWGPKK